MTNYKKFICKFCSITLLLGVLLFCGVACDTDIQLDENSINAYNQVLSYSQKVENSSDKANVLNEIKRDIATYSNKNNEIEIGKLKLDLLALTSQYEKDVENAEITSRQNKSKYQTQMQYIGERYSGTQSMYNSEIRNLNQQKSDAYSKMLKEVQSYYGRGFATGFVESIRREKQQEYESFASKIDLQIKQLEYKWENKQKFDTLQQQYLNADSNLENTKNNLKTNFNRNKNQINNKINILKQKRL